MDYRTGMGPLRRRWLAVVAPLAIVMSNFVAPAAAPGVTPESPEVKRLVAKGIAYLEESGEHGALGGKALVGLALVKNGSSQEHPRVLAAISACQQACKNGPEKISADIYSTGLAIIFLCSLDGSEHANEIMTLLKSLELRQREHGGWGYPDGHSHGGTGDTSMTQYGVLSAWEAKQVGFDLSLDSIERVANWLLRTQDPSGAWGYQGHDPGNFNLVNQSNVRHSMAAAGLGSTLISAQLLGMIDFAETADEGVPAVLKPVIEGKKKQGVVTDRVDPKRVKAAIGRGNRWMGANYKIDPDAWTHYYMYALERYMSFRELAEGRAAKEPKWYNDGYALLARTQKRDGSWESEKGAKSGVVPETAFAVLFLLRSTKKSIERAQHLGNGTLAGGRGLPSSFIDVKLRRGKLVGPSLEGTAADLISVLTDPNHPDFDELVANPDDLVVSDDPAERARQSERLRRLARGRDAKVRVVAVRALARKDDFDEVPTLIYGLSDPDPGVVREARDGLRLVSRRFDGFGLPDRFTEDARQDVTLKWRNWYLTVRPHAVLDD